MAINNPYIPGDPYSYDLKWLVAKVKEILAQLGTLDEAIEAKIFEGFLEHSIVQFKTVPEMLAADITDGSIVLTLGYHEAGDHGGLFYLVKDFNPSQCALDYFLTLDNNKQIAIPVIVTPYVTPEMFGAYGDNTNDDSDSFEAALKYPAVILSDKSYKIGRQITTTSPVHLSGVGSEKSQIYSDASSFAFVFTTGSIAWRASEYIIEKLSIHCDGGCVKMSNATQSALRDCRFYNVREADTDNVLFTNESHFSTIENCYVYGGNGIVVDDDTNGISIKNNYVTYCNKAIYIKGGHEDEVLHNDVEGFSVMPYFIACSSSNIEIIGERNKIGKWIQIEGNKNDIVVRDMSSDGGHYYDPLMTVSGNANKIRVMSASGYNIIPIGGNSGIGNSFEFVDVRGLLNARLFQSETITGSNMPDDERPLAFDIDTDDITPFIKQGDYTYTAATKTIQLTGSTRFELDFSSLRSQSPTEALLIYIETTGVSAPPHGQFYMKTSNGETGPELNIQKWVSCLKNNNVIYTNPSANGVAFRFTKLRVAYYGTSKLIK